MFHREQVEIEAEPAAVWAVLTDVQHWHTWTPSIELIRRPDPERPFGVGSRVWIKQPRLRGAHWQVTAYEPERSFVWHTRAPGAKTEAGHQLQATPTGTRVTLDLRLTGPLALLGRLLYGRLIRRYLALEALGLKTQCETTPTA
ncbi:polyketide cyclase [Kitasatospora acidiphila]|uniref:Polyketide cyclase n=1 Tax=Kitasatospora acidiphila TaxID=2567942 RepID=A0A540W9I1_9ACTN|nr:SRPBCC family protein [Kitasatospora acidiphila]TQF05683.1 polyketide cyclase [Kitasatospora acidiphila]